MDNNDMFVDKIKLEQIITLHNFTISQHFM